MSSHSVPLHCPYCAGENLHPHGDVHGAWECRDCVRAFSVKFIGLLSPSSTSIPSAAGPREQQSTHRSISTDGEQRSAS